MITQSQLDDIRNAYRGGKDDLERLLSGWQAELYRKELDKAGVVMVTIKGIGKAEGKTWEVPGVKVGNAFAITRSIDGDKQYKITHINTGLSLGGGMAKKNAYAIAKELMEQEFWPRFDKIMETYESGGSMPEDFHTVRDIVLKRR